MQIRKTAQNQTKKGVQSAKNIVSDELSETLKSTQRQIGLPEASPQNNRQEYVAGMAEGISRSGYDPRAHDQEKQVKLESLRKRLQALQEEELQKAAIKNQKEYEKWDEQTNEALKGGEGEEPEYRPAVETGSKKKRGGIMGAIKNKVTKSETGRKKA